MCAYAYSTLSNYTVHIRRTAVCSSYVHIHATRATHMRNTRSEKIHKEITMYGIKQHSDTTSGNSFEKKINKKKYDRQTITLLSVFDRQFFFINFFFFFLLLLLIVSRTCSFIILFSTCVHLIKYKRIYE